MLVVVVAAPLSAQADVNNQESGRDRGQIDFIDQQIENGWRRGKVAPSTRCNDYEFIRRASLDIIGRIPTVKEVCGYLCDPEDSRRAMLIERLLASPECAENFAEIWTTLLLHGAGSARLARTQLRWWLTDELSGRGGARRDQAPDWARTTRSLLSATGETNQNGAVSFVLHHLGKEQKLWADEGKWDMVPITSRTGLLFLGQRLECVRCHDHPYTEATQNQFWGLNAFFRQVDSSGQPRGPMRLKGRPSQPVQQYELADITALNSRGLVFYERLNGALFATDAVFVDGKKLTRKADSSRRQQLAALLTASPYFAKAFVNRLWAHFMGNGFTSHAVDDFGDHNPTVHAELLDRLAAEWARRGHDPRELMRWICNSRPYGLSSVANATNDKQVHETLFARMLVKPLTPAQIFDSVQTATQAPRSDAARAERDTWVEHFVIAPADDDGEREDHTLSGTLSQALLLMNGAEVHQAVMNTKQGTMAALLAKQPFNKDAAASALEELYLAALARPPIRAGDATGQHDEVKALLRIGAEASRSGSLPDDPGSWTGYYQDVFWALLNSNEFLLNH